jgi:hypothetical protein
MAFLSFDQEVQQERGQMYLPWVVEVGLVGVALLLLGAVELIGVALKLVVVAG